MLLIAEGKAPKEIGDELSLQRQNRWRLPHPNPRKVVFKEYVGTCSFRWF